MSKSKLSIVGDGSAGSAGETCSTDVAFNVANPSGTVESRDFRGQAAVVTLGCAKNQVDSEVMLGVLRREGFAIVNDLTKADVAVVNTCGFLQSSVKESIDCILNLADYKKSGRLRKLIVAGCLVERYKDDLKKTLPEVDSFISVDDLLKVGEVAQGGVDVTLNKAARPYFLYDESMPRQLSTRPHTAYVKVSEGCNRPCTFCIIPKLRGGMRSRTLESVVDEVKALGAQGIREVNLVAQDLTSYGTDRKGPGLAALLKALDDTAAVDWIRLLYAYPIGIDEELLATIAERRRLVEYLDLPLQHSAEAVLRPMQRPLGRYSPRSIIEFIRSKQPSIHLRTTFIVGFPGETEQDIQDLESFVREGHFTNVGVFTYSPEEGTPSFEMEGHIPDKEKSERRKRIMLAQQEVNAERLSGLIGKEIEVMVEGTHEDTDLLISGRARFQAPDVDGTVIVNDVSSSCEAPVVGEIGMVEVTEIAGYDLIGTWKSRLS